jgi:hypothetical protein
MLRRSRLREGCRYVDLHAATVEQICLGHGVRDGFLR